MIFAIVLTIIKRRVMSKKRRKREREFTEDYLDMVWFAEKAIWRGEMTREEVDAELAQYNPYTFHYDD